MIHPIHQEILHTTASNSDQALIAFASRLTELATELRTLASVVGLFVPEPAEAFDKAAGDLDRLARLSSIDPALLRGEAAEMVRGCIHAVSTEPTTTFELDPPSPHAMWKMLAALAGELSEWTGSQRDRDALHAVVEVAHRALQPLTGQPQTLQLLMIRTEEGQRT